MWVDFIGNFQHQGHFQDHNCRRGKKCRFSEVCLSTKFIDEAETC